MSKGSSKTSNVLLTLGVLFTVGGATRFIPNGLASAEATSEPEAAAAEHTQPELASSDPIDLRLDADAQSVDVEHADHPEADVSTSSEAPAEVCFDDAAAEALQEDRWLFEQAKEDLRTRELDVATKEQDIERRAAELDALHQEITARWEEMQVASNADLEHLADMYTAMKPGNAAEIFNQMDPSFAAGFLKLMPSEQAGQVLANMDAQSAYIVSVRLASVNEDIRSASRDYR